MKGSSSPAAVISIAALLAALPWIIGLILVLSTGQPVTVFQQPIMNQPCPPLSGGDRLTQSFSFDSLSTDGLALRFGTYGRRLTGTLTLSIDSMADGVPETRSFTIDLKTLTDNTWQIYRFAPFEARQSISGQINLDIRHVDGGYPLTLWRAASDSYPGGKLTINGHFVSGDLAHQWIRQYDGLSFLHLALDRWRTGKTGLPAQPAWPALLAFLAVCFTGLAVVRARNSGDLSE